MEKQFHSQKEANDWLRKYKRYKLIKQWRLGSVLGDLVILELKRSP